MRNLVLAKLQAITATAETDVPHVVITYTVKGETVYQVVSTGFAEQHNLVTIA